MPDPHRRSRQVGLYWLEGGVPPACRLLFSCAGGGVCGRGAKVGGATWNGLTSAQTLLSTDICNSALWCQLMEEDGGGLVTFD